MNDCSYFSIEKFWEFYDSIAKLVTESYYDREISMQISVSYQSILKMMIYHFSPHDVAVMKNFPDNYDDYIERLDCAVLAYYTQNSNLLSDETFALQR
ncbi:MAG: immunity 41 family protein, partial [Oscillospiraceae bacterium]|nr:immunity 41 family protein [Oscillospiraceae bacterium]